MQTLAETRNTARVATFAPEGSRGKTIGMFDGLLRT